MVSTSVLPLETYLIITNEELMPGLTKILQLEQDFEFFNWNPENEAQWESNSNRIVNNWVYLYESKGTQPIWVKSLAEFMPTEIDVEGTKQEMMRYIFEFVKRVILTYAQTFTQTVIEQEEDDFARRSSLMQSSVLLSDSGNSSKRQSIVVVTSVDQKKRYL